ncbi:unnamed protein product [Prorocentrum cordatum]|uniref:Uncharacterized protein n=1 Tax=Prorocentrum cordatum TaxID=2364126 RepID=A0ABN9U8Y9_9DINO|nr:unnamed protein product [Polarella glacialis]
MDEKVAWEESLTFVGTVIDLKGTFGLAGDHILGNLSKQGVPQVEDGLGSVSLELEHLDANAEPLESDRKLERKATGQRAATPQGAVGHRAIDRYRFNLWWRWRQAQHAATRDKWSGPHPQRFNIQRWEEQISEVYGEGFSEDICANAGWFTRALDRAGRKKAQADRGARALDANDVDGWKLERPQLDLAEEVDDDLLELQVLLGCCERDGNRHRISAAILEFEVKARVRRTWAWFPLERYEWSGHEYAEPKVKLSFKVPGAGALPARDVHCDFGTDWFDLKVWNVVWPESPEVKYHHRVKKTRLMHNCALAVHRRGDG